MKRYMNGFFEKHNQKQPYPRPVVLIQDTIKSEVNIKCNIVGKASVRNSCKNIPN